MPNTVVSGPSGSQAQEGFTPPGAEPRVYNAPIDITSLMSTSPGTVRTESAYFNPMDLANYSRPQDVATMLARFGLTPGGPAFNLYDPRNFATPEDAAWALSQYAAFNPPEPPGVATPSEQANPRVAASNPPLSVPGAPPPNLGPFGLPMSPRPQYSGPALTLEDVFARSVLPAPAQLPPGAGMTGHPGGPNLLSVPGYYQQFLPQPIPGANQPGIPGGGPGGSNLPPGAVVPGSTTGGPTGGGAPGGTSGGAPGGGDSGTSGLLGGLLLTGGVVVARQLLDPNSVLGGWARRLLSDPATPPQVRAQVRGEIARAEQIIAAEPTVGAGVPPPGGGPSPGGVTAPPGQGAQPPIGEPAPGEIVGPGGTTPGVSTLPTDWMTNPGALDDYDFPDEVLRVFEGDREAAIDAVQAVSNQFDFGEIQAMADAGEFVGLGIEAGMMLSPDQLQGLSTGLGVASLVLAGLTASGVVEGEATQVVGAMLGLVGGALSMAAFVPALGQLGVLAPATVAAVQAGISAGVPAMSTLSAVGAVAGGVTAVLAPFIAWGMHELSVAMAPNVTAQSRRLSEQMFNQTTQGVQSFNAMVDQARQSGVTDPATLNVLARVGEQAVLAFYNTYQDVGAGIPMVQGATSASPSSQVGGFPAEVQGQMMAPYRLAMENLASITSALPGEYQGSNDWYGIFGGQLNPRVLRELTLRSQLPEGASPAHVFPEDPLGLNWAQYGEQYSPSQLRAAAGGESPFAFALRVSGTPVRPWNRA